VPYLWRWNTNWDCQNKNNTGLVCALFARQAWTRWHRPLCRTALAAAFILARYHCLRRTLARGMANQAGKSCCGSPLNAQRASRLNRSQAAASSYSRARIINAFWNQPGVQTPMRGGSVAYRDAICGVFVTEDASLITPISRRFPSLPPSPLPLLPAAHARAQQSAYRTDIRVTLPPSQNGWRSASMAGGAPHGCALIHLPGMPELYRTQNKRARKRTA